ncbi:MAG: hypothetical protein AAFQ42_02735 [Pseudomonadota bacterium]
MSISDHSNAAAFEAPKLKHEDLRTLAVLLESRHGAHARGIAEFFSGLHARSGDAEKCWAWGGVAAIVAQRQRGRIEERPSAV